MVVHRSKIVHGHGSLGQWGTERDATLTLSARMLRGSGISGEWHCATSSRAESEAILCGSAQGVLQPGKGSGKGKGVGKGGGNPPQREQRYPGRLAPTSGPQFSHAPTFHAPRPNKRNQTDK